MSLTDRRTTLSLRSGNLSLVVAIIALCSTTAALAVQEPETTDGPGNYDIRRDDAMPARQTLAGFRIAAGRDDRAEHAYEQRLATAETRLAEHLPGLVIEYARSLGVPEVIGRSPRAAEFLTSASTGDRVADLRGFMHDNAGIFGLTAAQIEDLVVVADYANPEDTLSFVHLAQRINGLPVFRGEIKAAFTGDGALVRTIGQLVPDLDQSRLQRDPGDVQVAVRAAATAIRVELPPEPLTRTAIQGDVVLALQPGPFAAPIRAEALYFPTEVGVARLAWRFLFWQPSLAWYVIVDAETGALLWRKRLTEHQSQTATYGIYSQSPAAFANNPTSPNGAQPPPTSRSQQVLVGNEPPNQFNNLGWITDGGSRTLGNNVHAGLDRVDPDGIDPDGTPTGNGANNRVFTPNYNPAPGNPAPGEEPLTPNYPPSMSLYQRGSVINAFYWSNRFHDRTYRLGFTEPARNFQNNNFGRGGVGGDRVLAQIQDSAGTNNANFATPADGTSGRMQMYIWTSPTPNRDGSLDRSILIHELTHGLSNRLIGNGDGLDEQQARGMGEGWSDFFALTLFATAADGINEIHGVGNYSIYLRPAHGSNNYYYGIRRYPYALMSLTGGPQNRPHNPLTFADIDPLQIMINDGAYPRDPNDPGSSGSATSVHAMGEIWASALMEVRARLIQRLGYTEGNDRMLQLVVNGMKMSPLNPDFIQARNALLSAAQAMDGSDSADVLQGFAIRGMGSGASTDGTHVVQSFSHSSITQIPQMTASDALCNASGHPDPGEPVNLRIPLFNVLPAVAGNVRLSINGRPPVDYGSIPAHGVISATWPFTVPPGTTCGAMLPISLAISSSLGNDTIQRSLRIGAPVLGLNQSFDGVTPPSLPAGWQATRTGLVPLWVTTGTDAVSAPNAARVSTTSLAGDSRLTSPSVQIGGVAADLTFRHRYLTELAVDGGVLEISIGDDAFVDIIQVGGQFLAGAYDGRINDNCAGTGNPLANRFAWSGDSDGWMRTTVRLPQLALNQSVRLRWRLGTSCSGNVAGGAWLIDNVSMVSRYQCATPVVCSDLIFRNGFEGP